MSFDSQILNLFVLKKRVSYLTASTSRDKAVSDFSSSLMVTLSDGNLNLNLLAIWLPSST